MTAEVVEHPSVRERDKAFLAELAAHEGPHPLAECVTCRLVAFMAGFGTFPCDAYPGKPRPFAHGVWVDQ